MADNLNIDMKHQTIKQYKNNNIRVKTFIKIFLDYRFKSMAKPIISLHKIFIIM